MGSGLSRLKSSLWEPVVGQNQLNPGKKTSVELLSHAQERTIQKKGNKKNQGQILQQGLGHCLSRKAYATDLSFKWNN